MQSVEKLVFQGIPDSVRVEDRALFRSRVATATNALMAQSNLENIRVTFGTPALMSRESSRDTSKRFEGPGDNELSIEDRVKQYQVRDPTYVFDQLIVTDELMEELLSSVEVVQLESLLFDHWGLRSIEPNPRTALNFHGPPGTGKTLAAHALASKLQRKLLVASYADIESKYVGDGPKNVQAVFLAAERSNAILFIDESDSLLSRRLTNVTQGAEQAINSMRSQLLMCLEQFHGTVIFATNLVENYDKAFETRVRNIHFNMPGERERYRLWESLLVPQLPQHNISLEGLATEIDDICGRDIKNAIIDAAVRVARQKRDYVEMEDLLQAVRRIKAARVAAQQPQARSLTTEESTNIRGQIHASLKNKATSGDSEVFVVNDSAGESL